MLVPTDINSIIEAFNTKADFFYRVPLLSDSAPYGEWQSKVLSLRDSIIEQQEALCECLVPVFNVDFPPQPDCSGEAYWRPNLAKLSNAVANLPPQQQTSDQQNVAVCDLYTDGHRLGDSFMLDLTWQGGCPRIGGGITWGEVFLSGRWTIGFSISVDLATCRFKASAGSSIQWETDRTKWSSSPLTSPQDCGPAPDFVPFWSWNSWGDLLNIKGTYQFNWLDEAYDNFDVQTCKRTPGSTYFKAVIR